MSKISQLRTLNNRKSTLNSRRRVYQQRLNAVRNMRSRATGELEGCPGRINGHLSTSMDALNEGVKGISSLNAVIYGIQDKRENGVWNDWLVNGALNDMGQEENYCLRKMDELDTDIRNVQRQIYNVQSSKD